MAAELLSPAPEGLMEVYEISPAVNRVANDSPALHEPCSADAAEPPAEQPKPVRKTRAPVDTGQGSLF
jgi:hypothetical protein